MNDKPYICYKTVVFYIYIYSFSTTFYAISISDTCIRSRKSISKPNFDISIHGCDKTTSGFGKRTAATLEYSITGLDFSVCIVIGMSFYI